MLQPTEKPHFKPNYVLCRARVLSFQCTIAKGNLYSIAHPVSSQAMHYQCKCNICTSGCWPDGCCSCLLSMQPTPVCADAGPDHATCSCSVLLSSTDTYSTCAHVGHHLLPPLSGVTYVSGIHSLNQLCMYVSSCTLCVASTNIFFL